MNPLKASPSTARGELAGSWLVAPALQAEPLPITAIDPAPCSQACPADVNVKAYVSLIAEERFAQALDVIRVRCPLPGICGRVCHHPCELACNRRNVDEPVAIRSLKRFVADLEQELPRPSPPAGEKPQRVAVIGSGPAGLTAAFDLRLQGYPVTVFEAEAEPGGMLRYGITAYRLPREVLSVEIDTLARTGIDIQTGRRLGKDLELEQLLRGGYSAVLLAVGAQAGRPLGIPGEEGCPQVEDALAFLRRVNDGERAHPGRRVVVIGGGATAVEAARSALRLGAESVAILYRRYREEVLASAEEVEAAESEGIAFRFLVAPSRVITEGGNLRALECVEVGLREPDSSGRRRPVAIPGSEFHVEADRVLAAVGQQADLDCLPPDRISDLAEHNLLRTDPATAMTALSGVFAAGDVVSGPSTVIEAIAAGHAAAESIRHFLEEGRPGIREQRPEPEAPTELGLPDAPPILAARIRPAMLRPERGREFAEVEQAFTAEQAVAEARRCLRCGPCGDCHICATTCHRRHVMVRLSGDDGLGAKALVRAPSSLALSLSISRPLAGAIHSAAVPPVSAVEGIGAGTAAELLPVRTHIREDKCRGCGYCVEVCHFGAVSLTDTTPAVARIEASLCRGCNLCVGVCPTGAAVSSGLSPEWWGSRLHDAFRAAKLRQPQPATFVVLACQRRSGALETTLDREGVHLEVIRFRCAGQIEAGMLLELCQHGARRVLVAGCASGRCRFGDGAALATEQIERARNVLKLLGRDEETIMCDWSGNRAHDRIDDAVRRLLGEAGCVPRRRLHASRKSARRVDAPGSGVKRPRRSKNEGK